ncbi:5-methyltetrahydropteroyltriglutamate--homocysteine S-methyltransferase [Hoyosella rhizosphaerae]|uniref:5-methyltetrahydropteroyltriglutamate--homocysteine S-methyltransferase n=1 Tax=Hoyosella rhizosphaerae TaxID=1755582 RepID=A0A916UID6_9ACTN|nr:5-methyltetrahydropteroyltriglutamate--homocysteine S-methyltransferase [Hoyosella rhizosphaerae]MBN4928410.1 5-methyltetrahydropteroyltriglutamate--homocysteine S-methyltransferase [Hoyosella rhizosphaerae]GGC74688.1 5-methyltetrahydropteroyltriglutamate--homocysteine methyltransferase [Hoyosella rhizosphaerae]
MTSSPHMSDYRSSILGYPRIGPRRELKRALDSYWHGGITQDELVATGRELQEQTWSELAATGLSQVPGNTFSFYDHVLDAAFMFGMIPSRFAALKEELNPLDLYFTMARGKPDFPPLELVKFISSNYYYRQPEIEPGMEFSVDVSSILDEIKRGAAAGIELRPVIMGPVTLLLMSKAAQGAPEDFVPLDMLDALLPKYVEMCEQLVKAGTTCVQLDEPYFTLERTDDELALFRRAYDVLGSAGLRPRLLVTGQYGDFGPALDILAASKVEAIGLDLVAARKTPQELAAIPGLRRKRLYAGVVSGRNVWKTDKTAALDYLKELQAVVPDIVVSTSCTLLHVPVDVLSEYDLPGAVADRVAFAKQKVGEVVALARALRDGAPDKWQARDELAPIEPDNAVLERVAAITDEDATRLPYAERREAQRAAVALPIVPTTTLGSFPQTNAVRQARYDLGQDRLSYDDYVEVIKAEIASVVRLQEDIGLDVFVHGEIERNDMIQYFAELMNGFAVTRNGWVQVYGSRCVRPPIIYGDVSRPKPMTLEWIGYAQSLTDKPVKAILTGPVTMLAFSFVREDQPLEETVKQIALAVRDETVDLENAGIKIIQVDEPAIRTLLPRRPEGREEYLNWAVSAFRLATAGVRPETQIHTHIGLSGVAAVVEAIEHLDADVTYIVSATRSLYWVLDALQDAGLTRGVGPGVYESRSARIPDIDEIDELLTRAVQAVEPERLWANPDGGLKTRHHWQLEPSLRNLVAAARRIRRRASDA